MKRALLWVGGAAALVVVLMIGLSQADGGSSEPAPRKFDLAAAQRKLAGAPAPLARLHAQSNQLIEADLPTFRKRLRALRGYPVVVNKWASWCGPCRAEFPILQQVATKRGSEIAFIGVNAGDSKQPARDFLAEYPVPFPSYVDPKEKISIALQAARNYPVTIFIDRRGETSFIHQGGFTSTEQLETSIARYLK